MREPRVTASFPPNPIPRTRFMQGRTPRAGRRAVCLLAAWTLVTLLTGLLACGCSKNDADEPEPLTLFGAASTTDVMSELSERFEAKTGRKVRTSFASSATVARQIEAGAKADVFISANESWMDHLEEKGRIETATRRNLLSNRLVLVAPAARRFSLAIEKDANFAGAFEGKLALADPSHAPAGRYAKESLTHLGWWGAIEPRVLPVKDVRAVMAAVESGSVGAGVVYATDAVITDRVVVVGTFPEASHAPIRFPVALVKDAKPGARDLLSFLCGPEAKAVYEKAGFTVIEPGV